MQKNKTILITHLRAGVSPPRQQQGK